MKIAVLGAGIVGKAMAIDLSTDFEVTSIDRDQDSLSFLSERYNIKTKQADLSGPLENLISDFDLIVGAVPGFMGFDTAKKVIQAGKNMVDISFFPEDPFDLDQLAKDHGVICVVDCGVAPGMGNIILGYHNSQMELKRYECLVGGLPVVREWPYEYRAVFSPIDVIEEYVRPARYVQGGQEIIREALSDPELVQFEGIGTLESWNSDGLRSLIKTMDIPDMIEKTLRYPGTIEYLRVLRETGFFSYDEVDVDGRKIRPIDLTAKLLFPKWKLKPGEQDFTVMRIQLEGTEDGAEKTYQYDLLDYYDKETEIISMARTTGYTATAVTHLVAKGDYSRIGISPPEFVGEDEGNFRFVLNYLEQRGVKYKVSES